MPSGLLNADISFPVFTGGESADQKIGQITNYLYMLLEELRYSFANIGADNINSGDMKEISDIINEPVNAQIGQINSDVSWLNGSVNILNQEMGQTRQDIVYLGQDISIVSQTANKINWLVASGTSASQFTLTPKMASLISETIDLTGYVTFNSLYNSGTTQINGDNIVTGTIQGINMKSGKFEALLDTFGRHTGEIQFWYGAYEIDGGVLGGGIKFDNQGAGTEEEARRRLIIYTDLFGTVIKIRSAGNISIEAAQGNKIFVGGAGQTVNLNGSVNINGVPQ